MANPIEKELAKVTAKRVLLEAQLVGLRAQEAALQRALRGQEVQQQSPPIDPERVELLEDRVGALVDRVTRLEAAPAADEDEDEDEDEIAQGFDPFPLVRPPLEQVRPPKPAETVERILGRVPGVDCRLEAANIPTALLDASFEEVGLAMGRHDVAEGLASSVTNNYVDTCIAALSVDPESPIDLTRAEREALRRGLERGHAEDDAPTTTPAPKKRRAPRAKQQPLGGV